MRRTRISPAKSPPVFNGVSVSFSAVSNEERIARGERVAEVFTLFASKGYSLPVFALFTVTGSVSASDKSSEQG